MTPNNCIESLRKQAEKLLGLELPQFYTDETDYRLHVFNQWDELSSAARGLTGAILKDGEKIQFSPDVAGFWNAPCPGEIFIVGSVDSVEPGQLVALAHQLAHLLLVAGYPIDADPNDWSARTERLYTQENPPPWQGVSVAEWLDKHAGGYLPLSPKGSIQIAALESIVHFIANLIAIDWAQGRPEEASVFGELNAFNLKLNEAYVFAVNEIGFDKLLDGHVRAALGKAAAGMLLDPPWSSEYGGSLVEQQFVGELKNVLAQAVLTDSPEPA
jgi:hypothetical protein